MHWLPTLDAIKPTNNSDWNSGLLRPIDQSAMLASYVHDNAVRLSHSNVSNSGTMIDGLTSKNRAPG
jgi:hypothetical protein